jgi:hypothetical protein
MRRCWLGGGVRGWFWPLVFGERSTRRQAQPVSAAAASGEAECAAVAVLAAELSVVGAAEVFVAAGRAVPGLTISDDGAARSWWWPLLSASDRALLASLLEGNDPEITPGSPPSSASRSTGWCGHGSPALG